MAAYFSFEGFVQVYKNAFIRIPRLVVASLGVALLANCFAFFFERITGHVSAFDEAVKLLIHYPEAISSMLSFFTTVLFCLCLTLVFEPSDLGRLGRKWIFVPSLNVVEHMLSLAIGVLIAWVIIDCKSIADGSVLQTFARLTAAILVVSVLALFCSALAVFLEHDYEVVVKGLGRYRFFVLFAIGGVLLSFICLDYVWNYKPHMG